MEKQKECLKHIFHVVHISKCFYHSIGFKENENIEQFKKGQKLESIGQHIELDMWIDYKGNDKQIIMEIASLCYKMRN